MRIILPTRVHTVIATKGATSDPLYGRLSDFVVFFNPRLDRWTDHFRLDGIRIAFLTPVGEVTSRILDFNHIDRLIEREELAALGHYPSSAALTLMLQS